MSHYSQLILERVSLILPWPQFSAKAKYSPAFVNFARSAPVNVSKELGRIDVDKRHERNAWHAMYSQAISGNSAFINVNIGGQTFKAHGTLFLCWASKGHWITFFQRGNQSKSHKAFLDEVIASFRHG